MCVCVCFTLLLSFSLFSLSLLCVCLAEYEHVQAFPSPTPVTISKFKDPSLVGCTHNSGERTIVEFIGSLNATGNANSLVHIFSTVRGVCWQG